VRLLECVMVSGVAQLVCCCCSDSTFVVGLGDCGFGVWREVERRGHWDVIT
jgi:hypothetical protein